MTLILSLLLDTEILVAFTLLEYPFAQERRTLLPTGSYTSDNIPCPLLCILVTLSLACFFAHPSSPEIDCVLHLRSPHARPPPHPPPHKEKAYKNDDLKSSLLLDRLDPPSPAPPPPPHTHTHKTSI